MPAVVQGGITMAGLILITRLPGPMRVKRYRAGRHARVTPAGHRAGVSLSRGTLATER